MKKLLTDLHSSLTLILPSLGFLSLKVFFTLLKENKWSKLGKISAVVLHLEAASAPGNLSRCSILNPDLINQTLRLPLAICFNNHLQVIQEDPLGKRMATYSCILAWRIPGTEGTCRLQSIGSQSWT